MAVYRVYVEKKQAYAVEGDAVLHDLTTALRIEGLKDVRIVNRYDVEGISKEDFEKAIPTVFSEPPVDVIYDSLPSLEADEKMFASEFLPGQFDQRADSAAQCIQILCQGERPTVKYAKIFILKGEISDQDFLKIKKYLINPVESRECGLETYKTLRTEYPVPGDVAVLQGFLAFDKNDLLKMISDYGLAMDLDDIVFCQEYFRSEQREPTITEIRMIDTYWSDHCRHTTFGTILDNVDIEAPYIAETFKEYQQHKAELGRSQKPVTLMDIAVMGMRKLKADGLIPDLDESEEINACSVKIDVDVDGETQKWLLMFKNETHNHPTEIEPFGGAATCLGGAIRDPLSGRSYVYQAMRVTGSSDPLLPVSKTREGKLPPRKITTTAAAGYSSYGNQVGLATGHVAELYHPGYMAKRMEIGAVIGAAPAENVRRERPAPGDIVILLGGRTGRDGCGGATGSSKSHSTESLESCGAEVQKGNAPEERKIQRLFRNPEVTTLIKRCNDFGAGGVSVAIGELADGLDIDLNAVPKKYEGLDGTELAISESQERMAVVVARENAERFINLALLENLEATPVAVVTDKNRLIMRWNDKVIVDLSRDFLNSNGADKHTTARINKPSLDTTVSYTNTPSGWESMVSDLNICSQRGLVQRFDSSIGSATVLMPFAGKTQQTPVQAMAAKIPVEHGNTTTASLMSWGFNPYISEQSPYHGAMYAVIESISKIVAAGGQSDKTRLTFQEYFPRTQNNPNRWGLPLAALLGAYKAQLELSCPSIGGKDSMSGTFEDLDVPPTLVSFAVAVEKTNNILSGEFKKAGSSIYYIAPKYNTDGLPDFESVKKVFKTVETAIREKKALSVWSVSIGGVAEAVFKMSLGNQIGVKLNELSDETLFRPVYGSFVIEADFDIPGAEKIGETIADYKIICKDFEVDINTLEKKWCSVLEPIFPSTLSVKETASIAPVVKKPIITCAAINTSSNPTVLIPVFPGTNGEYDMAGAFERNGAKAETFVIRNLNSNLMQESVEQFTKLVQKAQIIAIPGGFSGGDEPEGSGKFINAFFRNPMIRDAVHDMLYKRDGLMLGICNGFQALIKLGLLPFGNIQPLTKESPTLTFNSIGRHQSQIVYTRIANNSSPWLSECKVGDIYAVPISHGEGRFVAQEDVLNSLLQNGQVATQYVDLKGQPTMDVAFNPNTSMQAIEGILSPDGRIFGKMGHSERVTADCFKNVPGEMIIPIFKSAVSYFK